MFKVKEKGLVTFHKPNSIISEQYRAIRTNIQFSSMDQEIKTLAITSPGVGDGKSTTATNLAVSMVQQGRKILLVDANLRKPTIHSIFKLPNTTGLTDALMEKVSWKEAIQQTAIERLEVLTSGTMAPHPAELLSSPGLEKWQTAVRAEYDMVIFDCCPVLDVSDARILAHQCDGVILVLSSGKTKSQKAVEAKRSLELVKSKLMGVIFNRKQ